MVPITERFSIKIVDFGFDAPLEGEEGSGWMKAYKGTPGYMAPEMIKHEKYQGQEIDMFALGVILFIMRTRHAPFSDMAKPSDMFYRLVSTHRLDLFWKAHEKNFPEGYFSDDFMDLVSCMLQESPKVRLGVADILGHPWMQGPMATDEEICDSFSKRDEQVRR